MALAVEETRTGAAHRFGLAPSQMPRVVTLTPAPAVDRVYFVDEIRQGHVNRASGMTAYLAGKGINVARNLHLAGNTVSAVVPMSAEDIGALEHDGLAEVVKSVEVAHAMRTNVILVDRSGTTTNVNAAPNALDAHEWSRLCQVALDEVQRTEADWLVLGGTLPIDTSTGMPVDVRALFRAAHGLGTAVCLDTAADGVTTGWDSSSQPDLIKPNAEELSSMTGLRVSTMAEALRAANVLRDRGIDTVLASFGPDGLLEVSSQGAVWARGSETTVVNTTGAGDAALAGYLSVHANESNAGTRTESLRRAVAWGGLAVQQPTTILPHIISDPRGIHVGTPDPEYLLS